ncbi:MFS transporter [Solimonas sp. C16B3]|uniref:MFS transporter n=1 Tax=Solimonas marina TaxID=2714601 RepID=A0A969W9B9_9GAMM|nr:MFS transporter [Solimonas marina]
MFSLSSLLLGVAFLLTGTGLFSTLLAVRGGLEGFAPNVLGLVMSCYFVGYLVGTYINPRIIQRVGHIRAFAIFAALASSTAVIHSLFVSPLAWGALRVITGACMVGLYTVVESWLNTQAAPEQRSRVFASYMVVNFSALTVGQFLLALYPVSGFQLFGIVAILLSLSLVPVALTSIAQPLPVHTPRLSLQALYRKAPVGIAGAFGSGLALGAFWGLGAAAAQRFGYAEAGVAHFMSVTIVGGALLQWPIGRWSDGSLDRRRVLFTITAGAAMAALAGAIFGALWQPLLLLVMFAFGGMAFAIYPISIALTNDRLTREEIQQSSSSLLLLNGVGAAIGPAVAGVVMSHLGPRALFVHFAVVLGALAAYALWRLSTSPEAPAATATFQAMLRTTPEAEHMLEDDEEPPVEQGGRTL